MTMNPRIALLLAGVLLILSNPCALAHTDVTAEQARELIDSTPDLTVVDVRERHEYCDVRGHIPGAVNYPWSSGVLQARYEELSTDGPVLVVCRSGGRSNAAANFLDSNGLSTVYDMLGGMSAWQWETTPCKYSGGSGTPDDPYQIATAADLIALGETPDDYDKHFILTADIDMDPNLPGRKVFDKAVIAFVIDDVTDNAFHGSFDGNGHTISNLVIEGGGYYIGLFGILAPGAEIKDLGVVDVNITSSDPLVGGLVGNNWDGTIANSYSSGVVTGDSHSVGGLVGANETGGTITNCFNTCTVSGNWRVGGLVGSSSGSITANYSTGTVTGVIDVGGLVGRNQGGVTTSYSSSTVSGNEMVGGLVGINSYQPWGRAATITDCYSSGTVTGDDTVGGLAGRNDKGSITSSFWDTEASGQSSSDGGTGKTTAEMQIASTFLEAGWDFVDEVENGPNDIWKISEGLDYPRLWWEKYGGMGEPNDPYLIYTDEQMNAMGAEPNDWDKHFKLMADIDLSGYSYDAALIAPDTDDSAQSFQGTSFTGVFDGNGHTISHLTIEGHEYLGLFGYVASGAEVENLGMVEVKISGSNRNVGGLAGSNGGKVVNCYVTGEVRAYDRVGGLVGSNGSKASISKSYSLATVTGDDNTGGLVGYNSGSVATSYDNGTVSGVYDVGGLVGSNFGIITTSYGTGAVSGEGLVGGLVGGNAGMGSIAASYSTGAVTGWRTVGGLAGLNAGSIGTSYSTGAVSGTGYVGGLVGSNEYGNIMMSYSTGIVGGNERVGGLVGYNNKGSITTSFWDVEISGQSTSAGGTGKTTAQMETASTFISIRGQNAGWDFVDETENGTDDIWWILEGQDYPRLWWEASD